MNSFLQVGPAIFLRPGFRFIVLVFILLCLGGCAGRLNKASDRYYAGQPQQALELLEKGDSLGNRNQLLFLMEKGVILHQLGQYRESIEQLLEAARMIDQFELVSISEQAGSLVTSEWLTRYKGEYSERLWVRTYLMMDYLLLGQYDDAQVEARQALKTLEKYPKALKDDFFTRSLIALCFANLDEDNDAYLVYRKLADDLPSPVAVAADLVRYAERLGMTDEVEKFRTYLHPQAGPEAEGELVLFVANGRVPEKRPGNVVLPPSIRFAFPYYSDSKTSRPEVRILPYGQGFLPPLTTDLADVARDALDARKTRIIAKETIRVATKEAIAQSVGNKNDATAEAIVRVTLFLLEEPDTRSWQTLPGRLTLVRVPLSVGRHKLQLQLESPVRAGRRLIDLPEVELRKGQRVFHSVRF